MNPPRMELIERIEAPTGPTLPDTRRRGRCSEHTCFKMLYERKQHVVKDSESMRSIYALFACVFLLGNRNEGGERSAVRRPIAIHGTMIPKVTMMYLRKHRGLNISNTLSKSNWVRRHATNWFVSASLQSAEAKLLIRNSVLKSSQSTHERHIFEANTGTMH